MKPYPLAIILVLAATFLTQCTDPVGNTRHYYIHPHGPVEMVQKMVFEGTAPEDAILLTEEEYLASSFHASVEESLVGELDFDNYIYIFAFVPFSGSEGDVEMAFDTVDGEGSTHVFTIDGEDAGSTSHYALFIWSALRVG